MSLGKPHLKHPQGRFTGGLRGLSRWKIPWKDPSDPCKLPQGIFQGFFSWDIMHWRFKVYIFYFHLFIRFFLIFQVVTNQRNNMSSQWRPLQPDTMPSNGSLSPLQFGQRPVSRQITKNPQVKILSNYINLTKSITLRTILCLVSLKRCHLLFLRGAIGLYIVVYTSKTLLRQ